MKSVEVADRRIEWYDADLPGGPFDRVLVDGPEASQRASHYNRVGALRVLPSLLDDEFVVIVDDAHRVGERLLVPELLSRCASSGIGVGIGRIVGANTQVILATPGYSRFLYL